jgi:V8-like Glu-specific endopeptidase
MKPLIFLLILAPILLFSCSEKKSSSEGESLVREIPTKNEAHAFELIKEANLKCEGFECIEGVGMFMATRSNALLTCTAFLIEDDIVATNSHCLPAVVKDLPDLCASKIQILFPEGKSFSEEKIACKELLGFSERPNAISPDLALIKLERKTQRKPVPVSRLGIFSGSKHTAIKVNPGNGASGILVKQDCTLVEKNYRLPVFDNPLSKIFVTGDCPSQAGNSGAPLLNGNGEAVGIFQADLPYSDQQKKAWQPYLLQGETFSPLAVGTNLFCLESNTRFLWNQNCDPIDDEAIERPRITDFDFSKELNSYLQNIPQDTFEWKSVKKTKTLESREKISPRCFHKFFSQEKEFELPILEAKIFFNRYMQVQPKFQQIGMERKMFLLSKTGDIFTLHSAGEEPQEISVCQESLL